MHLLQLPEELLLQVLGYLTEDKGQLCRTALVSCRLGDLVRIVLPRDIHFQLYTGDFERCQMFIRACIERPEIAEHTHQVHSTRCGMNGTRNTCDILNSLLTRLKAVRWLNISLRPPSHSNGWSLPALYQNPFPELRSLELYLPTISASEIFHFLKLPNIRNLNVDGVRETRDPEITDDADSVKRASRVDQMDICWTPVNPRDMDSILSFSRRLTSLHCIMPGRFRQPFNNRNKQEMMDAFSPRSATLMLRPIQETLVNLALTVDAVGWPRHDGSKLDLTGCRSLRWVIVSSSFFFESAEPSEDRNGVWPLLPKNIEEFMIEFTSNEGLFYSADRLHTGNFTRSWYTETRFSDCSWLVEIAAHKAERYPKLESVIMSELDSVKGTGAPLNFRCLPWQCPTELLNVFGTSSISLTGYLRAPKDWTETQEEAQMPG